jgi:hypothetical protein
MTFAGSDPGGVFFPHTSGTVAAMQRGLFRRRRRPGLLADHVDLAREVSPEDSVFGRVMLVPPGGDPTMMGALGADMVWPLVGHVGRALSDLRPGGSTRVSR